MSPEQRAELDKAEAQMKAVESALLAAAVEVDDLTVAAGAAGNVAISGIARSAGAARIVTEVASSVPGVKRVINTILPMQ
jgi:osmotically-inducible protein OsmY